VPAPKVEILAEAQSCLETIVTNGHYVSLPLDEQRVVELKKLNEALKRRDWSPAQGDKAPVKKQAFAEE